MKVHEERDALRVANDQLAAEKRAMERELDALRLDRASGAGRDSQRESVALLNQEQQLLREEYEAELE